MLFKNESIWIIGASNGIGRDLAIALAKKNATLILSARNKKSLDSLKKKIGNQHITLPLDVSNYKQITAAVKKIKNLKTQLNRVIFMAGIYDPKAIKDINITNAQKTLEINFNGALYITKEILPLFEKQKLGQIILCASVAGYIGLPNGQPYCATKAALINFAESLYIETPEYIDVKVINPGFVKTRLTDKNNFKMPMIITAKEAANIIINNLNNKNFEINFPKRFTFIMKLLSILPYKTSLFLISKLNKKKSL